VPTTIRKPAVAGHPVARSMRTRAVVALVVVAVTLAGLAAAPAAAAVPPANDLFAGAAVLDGPLPVSVAGTNVDATSEPGEPLDGATSGSVWYRWTAPSADRVLVEVCSQGFGPRLGIYEGPTVDSQALVQEGLRPSDDECGQRTSVSFVPTPGTTYNLSVRGWDHQSGAFDLTIRQPAAPNDDFDAADILPSILPVTATTSTEEATKELGEPSHAGDPGLRSVWYAWTPAESGSVAVSTCGSDFDTLLAVYTGVAVNELTVITSNDDDPGQCGSGRQSRAAFDAVAGTAYMIAVDGWSGSSGNLELSIAAPNPGSDGFADAEGLAGELPIEAPGTNVGATTETGEPDPGPAPSSASVWFEWTPVASTLVAVTACDSDFATHIAVYTGDDVTNLVTAGGGDRRCGQRGAATFAATAGTTYRVRVAGVGGATGNFTLRIAPATPPANDDFDQAEALPGSLPVAVPGSTLDATREVGEPPIDAVSASSVWFSWTPDVTTLVEVATCGGEGLAVLAVYTGAALVDLDRVASNSFGCANGSTVTMLAEAATTYWIAADGYDVGQFTLTITQATRPGNDLFADATVIDGPLPISLDGTNTAATLEAGEPLHADTGGTSVWYRWTAPTATQVTIDTCTSAFDTMLAVYTGTTVTDLAAVTSNDDRCGRQSEVTFEAEAGTTYWIAVDGWHGAQGPFHLSLTATNRPANDDFDDAQALAGPLPITGITGTTYEATRQPGEPQDGLGGGATAWYRYTPSVSGTHVIASCASGMPLDLDVYTGDRVYALTLVPSRPTAYDCGSDQDSVELVAGTEYSIAVEGRYGDAGDFRFGIFLSDAPANDDFAEADVLIGPLPITFSGANDDATSEPGEPEHSGDPFDGGSLWYRWTPTETTWVAVDGDSLCSVGGGGLQFVMYTGQAVDALTPLPGRGCEGSGTIHFEAQAGTTYHLAVQSSIGAAIDFDLTIRELDRPANDDLARAQVVRGQLPRVVEGTLLDGTLEPSEPRGSLPVTSTSVWYAWTAPASGPMTIETCGSDFTTHIGVFTGTTTDALTRVASENHACGLNGTATFEATRGTTYLVQVTGTWFHYGRVRLTFRTPVRPPNDAFADAQVVAGSDPIVVRDANQDATREAGEPLHAGEGGGSSLWYRWTAPTTGEYRIDTCGSGVFGTQLAVYTGTRVDVLTAVAADGNDCPSNRHGEVTLVATAGTTYQVAIDTEEGEQGGIQLTIRRSRRPANDDFTGAVVLTGPLPLTTTGSSLDATAEPGEPRNFSGGYDTNASAIWYRWTAPTSGTVSVESCGSGFESLVGVFTGTAVDALTRVPSSDTGCVNGWRSAFYAVAGTTYQIAVDGSFFAAASTGPVQLTIRQVPPPQPPANDDFVDATVLAGPLPISATGRTLDATAEPGEPQHRILRSPLATVWYSWTADVDGPVVLDVCDVTNSIAALAVWVGSSVDQLVRPDGELFGFPDASCQQRHLEIDARIGTTYHIAVEGPLGSQGDFTLQIRRPVRPDNDDFAAATPIAGALPIEVTVDVTDASPQRPLEAVDDRSAWYRWTAPNSRTVVIDGCDPHNPGTNRIFTGDDIATLEPVGERVDGCDGTSWTLTPTRGTTYWIAVTDGRETGLPQTFLIRELDPPANDDFHHAQVIPTTAPRPLTITGDSTDATTERDEPRHAGSSNPTGSVWYRYTPTTAEIVTIDTCERGESFDVLAVYTGSSLGRLVRVTDGGTGGAGLCGGFGIDGVQVSFAAQPGTTYLIAYDGNDGGFQLTIR
jgi:hypothetical protein